MGGSSEPSLMASFMFFANEFMAIIISKNGKDAKKIDKSNFEKEDYLQAYIYDNPESIPLYDIKEDIRLLILAREFSTDSGPIDAIGIDKDGVIYLIETKLYKNPDKRLVVAQVLDYGASLWRNFTDFNEFIRKIDDGVNKKFNISLNQKLKDFFDINDEEITILLDNIQRGFNDGAFKFVVLMDKLHEHLKNLIVFINQNSQFDIFAVELEYYKHENFEIMIPKLFGAEVKKDISVSSSNRKGWNEESFFQAVAQDLEKPEFENMKRIYNEFVKIADKIKWGTGASLGSYAPVITDISPNGSLISIFANGKLSIKFNWFYNNEKEKKSRDRFKELLNRKAKGLKIPENFRDIGARFELKEWLPYADAILEAFKELKKS